MKNKDPRKIWLEAQKKDKIKPIESIRGTSKNRMPDPRKVLGG